MNMRPFEIVLVTGFVIAAIVGVFLISNSDPKSGADANPFGKKVEIWGTIEQRSMDAFLEAMSDVDDRLLVVRYREIDERVFEDELVNAIAEGRSPDLILLSHRYLALLRQKIQPISYETLPERTFRDTYIDGTDIFMRSDGIYGIPVGVDPLVMYWNRDIFSSAGLVTPPKTWETLITETTPAITKRNDAYEITQSAVAFGEYQNVRRAKEVIAMLLLQAGSSIVEERDSEYAVTFNDRITTGLPPGEAVMSFYTQFSTPTKVQYTWNRAQELDRKEFLQGTLGLYFGMGSERVALERENANLSFDMTEVPQGSGATLRRNYGEFYAFAIPRGSQNASGAYAVGTLFGTAGNAEKLIGLLNIAPVHRSLHGKQATDLYTGTLYQSAVIARGWLDPNPEKSGAVFETLIEETLASGGRVTQALQDAIQTLESLF
jgi:ABC-type glycerol-3-phosphate transport system substrate-binding protein